MRYNKMNAMLARLDSLKENPMANLIDFNYTKGFIESWVFDVRYSYEVDAIREECFVVKQNGKKIFVGIEEG